MQQEISRLIKVSGSSSISQSHSNRVKSDDVTNDDAVACLLLLIDRIIASRVTEK